LLLVLPVIGGIGAAVAQPLDLSQGGPITVTARDGLEWHQAEQEVIALGDARAVRQNVTVAADRLIAYYRKKAEPGTSTPGASTPGTSTPGASTPGTSTPGASKPVASAQGAVTAQPVAAQPVAGQSGIADETDTSGTEIYRLRAEGNVQIFTATDHAQGDVAVYDIDQAVMVMTGHDLRLTTPNDILTARDTMEYWPQKHMAVARGNAVVVTKDARRIAADVLVAYTTDTPAPTSPGQASAAKPAVKPQAAATPPGAGSGDDLTASGKLEKVEAFGHVSVRTPTDTAIGERAVYVPDSGIARLAGNVRITRGQNQLEGQEAEVNMKTGIARLLRGETERVTGLVVPNDTTNRDVPALTQPSGGANPTGGATGPATGKPSGGAPGAAKPAGGHS
jgi:lipopolysaccharide export system protein LptA